MTGHLSLILVILTLSWGQTIVWAQTMVWTDSSGQFEVVADFLRLDDDKVHLRRLDGSILAVELSKLSPDHRDRARNLAELAKAGGFTLLPTASRGRSKNPFKDDQVIKLTLDITGKHAPAAVAIGPLKIDQVRADGRPLKPTFTHLGNFQNIDREAVDTLWLNQALSHPEGEIRLPLEFDDNGADAIDLFQGSVEIWVGRVELVPLGKGTEMKAGPINNPELKKAGVAAVIQLDGATEFRVVVTSKSHLVREVIVYDGLTRLGVSRIRSESQWRVSKNEARNIGLVFWADAQHFKVPIKLSGLKIYQDASP